jgi:hypothetical protein
MREMTRRLARTGVGLALGAVGWLTVIPVVQFVRYKRLRARHPELFDATAARRSVDAAVRSSMMEGV